MACLVSLSNKLYPSGFGQELKGLAKLAWPIILTQLAQVLHGPVSLIFCGHLGDKEKLDGAALAVSMINVLCLSVGQGMGTACDTYFSQGFEGRTTFKLRPYVDHRTGNIFMGSCIECSVVLPLYFGSNNTKRMGIILQRALCIFLLGLIPCYAIQMNLELILRLVGQEPRIAKLAGDYIRIFLPGAFCFFIYVILSKYIQNQNRVLPNMIVGLISVAFNAILHYVLLYVYDLGTNGAAISQTVTYFLMLVLTIVYIFFSKIYKDSWDGFSRECFEDWGPFGFLAAAGVLGICMEWWNFEISLLLSGLVGPTELGAQSVLLQIDAIWFQIPMGLSTAVTIRVGHYLGEGDACKAKTATWVGLTLTCFISVSALIVIACFLRQLPYVFTNVEDVSDLASQVLPVMLVYIFFDAISFIGKGYFYGTGKQGMLSVFVIVTYYVISLPIGIPLMFLTYLRLRGIWLGLCCAVFILSMSLFLVIVFTDWDKEVTKVQERVAHRAIQDLETVEGNSEKRILLRSPGEDGSEAEQMMKSTSVAQLVCRRTAVVLAFLLLLLAAVLFKIFFVLPDNCNNPNMDYIKNSTNMTCIYYHNITSRP